MTALRWTLGVAGLVLIGWGAHRVQVGGLATDPVGILRWLLVGLLAHDLLIAGITAAGGAVLTRLVPAPARGVVAGGSLVGAALVLVSVPLLSGRGGGNPSADPLHYRLDLAVLLLAVAAVTGGLAWRRLAATRESTVDEGGEGDA